MAARKQIGVVVNPSSAGGRSLTLWPELRKALEADGFRIQSRVSASETDFRNCTCDFSRRFKTIAVCGGDSSLTIAAEELLAAKYAGELKFLPAGSVNDIVLDIREQGSKKPVYLGELAGADIRKLFIGQANWGLGVVVNRWVGKVLHTQPWLRPLQNFIGTLSIIFAHLLRREIVRLTITADGKATAGSYSIVLVSQIRHWASGLLFAPAAAYIKPEFQLVTVRRCGLVRLIRIILAAKAGKHLGFPEVESRLARRLEIAADRPVAVQIDGDILRENGKEQRRDKYTLAKKQSAFRLTL